MHTILLATSIALVLRVLCFSFENLKSSLVFKSLLLLSYFSILMVLINQETHMTKILFLLPILILDFSINFSSKVVDSDGCGIMGIYDTDRFNPRVLILSPHFFAVVGFEGKTPKIHCANKSAKKILKKCYKNYSFHNSSSIDHAILVQEEFSEICDINFHYYNLSKSPTFSI